MADTLTLPDLDVDIKVWEQWETEVAPPCDQWDNQAATWVCYGICIACGPVMVLLCDGCHAEVLTWIANDNVYHGFAICKKPDWASSRGAKLNVTMLERLKS
jgi:hypothetical protein